MCAAHSVLNIGPMFTLDLRKLLHNNLARIL